MLGTSSFPLQIGGPEWFWVVLIAIVLLFGPKKLPELARALGKATGEFQRGRAEIEREIRAATQAIQTPITETTQAIRESIQAPITETRQAIQPSFTLEPRTLPTSPPPPASLPPPTERDRLEKAARDLGIPTEGKTDEQLKEEIRKSVS